MMDLVSCQQKIILRWLMSRYLVWICCNQLHGMRPLLIWYALSRDTYVVQFGYVNLRLFCICCLAGRDQKSGFWESCVPYKGQKPRPRIRGAPSLRLGPVWFLWRSWISNDTTWWSKYSEWFERATNHDFCSVEFERSVTVSNNIPLWG